VAGEARGMTSDRPTLLDTFARRCRRIVPPTAASVLTALVASVGVTFNGLNNAFGGPIMFLLWGGLLAVLLVSIVEPRHFWAGVATPLGLATLAYGWATLPLWALPTKGTYLAPDLLLPELLSAAALGSAFLAGALAGSHRGGIARVTDWLLLFGALNIALGLLLREVGPSLPWDLWQSRPDFRFTGTLSNPNVAGTYLGMLAVLGLHRIITNHDQPSLGAERVRTAARWIMVLLCTGACAITASRSAMVATASGLALLGVVHMLRFRQYRYKLPLPGLLILGGAMILAAGLADPAMERFELLGRQSTGRGLMWEVYAAASAEAPLFGYGPGGFPTLNLRLLSDPRMAQELWMVNSPHNLILQLVLKGGIPFLALLAAAMVIVIARAVWNSNDERLGLVCAIGVAVACSMVDIALDVPALAALTLLLAGLAWGRQAGTRSASRARTSRHRSRKGT
jgi:O-antigen ligase